MGYAEQGNMVSDSNPPERNSDAIDKVRDGVLRLQNLLELIRIEQNRSRDAQDQEPSERLDSA